LARVSGFFANPLMCRLSQILYRYALKRMEDWYLVQFDAETALQIKDYILAIFLADSDGNN
jgi:hypothetical protein